MTLVAILPEPTDDGVAYRAIAGTKQSLGKTAGEALDALTNQLPEEESGTLVVVQSQQPDQYFTAEQRRRLTELMDRWRAARDLSSSLPADEQAELDALADAELRASAARAAALARDLSR
ncbi:MAG TPA: hypothetical protein VF170_10250 [Planctomycetaceae bacterium]